MFNDSFFPTPKNVIIKMLEPYKKDFEYNLENRVILEPSCGKGNILDFIKENARYQDYHLYCIEIEEELQLILQGKGYKLIDKDFLEHEPDFNYDLIIMNPPFANGDEHLLKAWDIMEHGEIICLLNEETVKNPCTKKRQLVKEIIDNNGSVEYLGDCFSTAERKTGVSVALVRLKKECKRDKFDFGDMETEEIKFNDDFQENSLALRDVLDNICIQYNIVKEEYIKLLKIKGKIKKYVDILSDNDWEIQRDFDLNTPSEKSLRDFLEKLKISIWESIAKKTKLEKFMTNRVRNDFNSYLTQQGSVNITRSNILKFIETIFLSRENIMQKAVEEVFDIFTKYYKENRCYVEGWKTNDKWKVNKKIILPYWISKWGNYSDKNILASFGDRFNISHRLEYTDIAKVMCFLAGRNYDQIVGISEALNRKFDILGEIKSGEKFDNTCESTFFKLKFFKKGTLHLEFKDVWLWEKFNKKACNGKNWLPEGEK